MHWELWDAVSRNQLAAFDVEADALAFVRELLGQGWAAEELLLLAEDEALPVEALPPAVSGAELARRAEAAGPSQRRTA